MERGRSLRMHLTNLHCRKRYKLKQSIEIQGIPIKDWFEGKGIHVFHKRGYASCNCSKRRPGRPHCGGYGCKLHSRTVLKERRKSRKECQQLQNQYTPVILEI